MITKSHHYPVLNITERENSKINVIYKKIKIRSKEFSKNKRLANETEKKSLMTVKEKVFLLTVKFK